MRPSALLVGLVLLSACRTDADKPEGSFDGLVDETAEDSDGDGVPAGEDCDDGDASVSPDAAELCDGIDNNCDGQIDEGVTSTFFADVDGDGFGDAAAGAERCAPDAGEVANDDDCDDGDSDVFPGATEVCDGADQDCDGIADNGLLETYFVDADADGHGDPEAPVEACVPTDGLVASASDCDDTDPLVSPDAEEVCNEVDDDCDELVDEGVAELFYADTDGDGFGAVDASTEACAQPPGYAVVPGDCDDSDAAVSPAGTELCNGIDDNCDGTVDEDSAADAPSWYGDGDSDGYGDPGVVVAACVAPTGTVADATDCDDTDAAVSPAGTELCNSIDDNCDGTVDEVTAADAATWYADSDRDGYGDASTTSVACAAPSGTVLSVTARPSSSGIISPHAMECEYAFDHAHIGALGNTLEGLDPQRTDTGGPAASCASISDDVGDEPLAPEMNSADTAHRMASPLSQPSGTIFRRVHSLWPGRSDHDYHAIYEPLRPANVDERGAAVSEQNDALHSWQAWRTAALARLQRARHAVQRRAYQALPTAADEQADM